MVKQLIVISFTSLMAQVSAGGCWNAACPNAAGDWGWCVDCGDLSTCCPPQLAYGCVDGKGCQCSSYGHCGTGSSADSSTPEAVKVADAAPLTAEVHTDTEVSAGGCWNAACPNAAGDWGWCVDCGDLSTCCPPQNAYGCVDGKGCKCSSYGHCGTGSSANSSTPEAVKVADAAPLTAEVRTEAEVSAGGCWNAACPNAAGDWGWCVDCGDLSTCCPPQLAYGCVDGKGCKCSSYGHCGTGFEAVKAADAAPPADEVHAEAAVSSGGCWNAACTNAAGDWGWCVDCGNLGTCCPPQNAYGCVDGKGCKCSSYGGCGTGTLASSANSSTMVV